MQDWMNKKNNELTIDLNRIFRALWKKIWVILIVVLVFAVVSYTYSACFITPTYMTSFTAYISNRQTTNSTSVSDLNASIGLAYLYSQIITSRTVLMDAAAQCGIQANYSTLRKMVNATISDTASLIQVQVVDVNPARAAKFAQAIADVAAVRVVPYAEGSSMMLVDPPVAPTSKYAPSNLKNTALGAMLGLVLACAVIVVQDLINDKVDKAEDLEQRHHIPVIGSIPDRDEAEKHGSRYGYRKEGQSLR